MGWLSLPANAGTSYIWSGLGDTIFPPFSTILLVVDARIPFPSLYDFLVKYLRPILETSQKLRIPQGWASSGGIGPNLFEEEIGKCENHKFQTNFPSVEICDVQYMLIDAWGGRLNLFPLSITHTCKQIESHRYHIFFCQWSNKWIKLSWNR